MSMTKRETIAAMAMQGQIQNSEWIRYIAELCERDGTIPAQRIASHCIEYADALIAGLDRTAPTVKESLTVLDDGCSVCQGATQAIHGDGKRYCYDHIPDARKMVPDDDGWIDHVPGDAMPCDGGLRVEVEFRDGTLSDCIAGQLIWDEFPGCSEASIIKWRPAR